MILLSNHASKSVHLFSPTIMNDTKVLPSMLLDALGGSSKGQQIKERKVRRSRSSSEEKITTNHVYHEDAPPDTSYFSIDQANPFSEAEIQSTDHHQTDSLRLDKSQKTVTLVGVPQYLHARMQQELLKVGAIEQYYSPFDSNYITVTFCDSSCASQVLKWDGCLLENDCVVCVKLGAVGGGAPFGSNRSSPDRAEDTNQSSIKSSPAKFDATFGYGLGSSNTSSPFVYSGNNSNTSSPFKFENYVQPGGKSPLRTEYTTPLRDSFATIHNDSHLATEKVATKEYINELDDDPVVQKFKPKQLNQSLLQKTNPPLQIQSSILTRLYDAFFGP